MRVSLTISGAAVCVALAAGVAHAQDPKFDYSKKDEKAAAAVEYKASAQAGLIITTGNSETTAISAAAKASRKAGFNKVQFEAGGAFARSSVLAASDANSDGVIDAGEIDTITSTTSKSWAVKGRYDRFLTEANSLYAAALAAGDQPAGKNLVMGGQVGYSRRLFKNAKHELLGEVGYDFSYEDLVVGDPVSIHSVRLFSGYTGVLSSDTALEGSLEALFNVNTLDTASGEIGPVEDTRLVAKIAITTKVFENINFRFGFTASYDHAPAARKAFPVPYAPGFVPLADELDTKTEATLIVNFL